MSRLDIDRHGIHRWFDEDELLHRDDGPALIDADHEAWYQRGNLHREDGPAIIWGHGRQAWYQNGKRHRVDGPAVTMASGGKSWYLNGERHRVDGPAITWGNGDMVWYLNDERISSSKEYQKLAGLSDEAMSVLILRYGEVS